MVNGTTDVAGAQIGGSQGANGNKEIIVNVKLTDINNSSGGNSRCTCGIFALNGMDGSSRMWSLMARNGEVLGSM